nr:hypothetical protein [Saprospiraceae bacterium]
MKKNYLLISICTLSVLLMSCIFTNISANAQCDTGYDQLTLELKPDNYPYEIGYQVIDINGGVLLNVPTGTLTTTALVYDTLCIPQGTCVEFRLIDTYGDGIIGDGYANVKINGVLEDVVNPNSYSYTHSHFIGSCPAGGACYNNITALVGSHTTDPQLNNTWYAFTPEQNGSYTIDVCENACSTTIWVYDHCTNLVWNSTNAGTYAHAEDGCENGNAHLNTVLVGGATYYIRIGSNTNNCAGTAINWTLTYLGPISGCTSPLSCNYNPLATVDDGSCLPVGDPGCPPGPDLRIDSALLVSSMYLSTVNSSENSCLVDEKCLSGYGTRTVVRFSTRIENIGVSDYYIGEPTNANTSTQFEWGPCHGHFHYKGYAQYGLYKYDTGQALPFGFKNGFCVLDLSCPSGGGQYSCGNMGITAGCADIYSAGLECQWIDITDVPAGKYTMVTKVNWDKSPDKLGRYEMSYANNWAQTCIEVTVDPVTGAKGYVLINDCTPYVDCAGEIYGEAQPDCTGQCAGTRKMGDWNLDSVRDIQDVDIYLNQCVLDTALVSPCRDLNADGVLNVADVVLLQECALHPNGSPLPGHTHEPCVFPFNVTNPNDTVTIFMDNWNAQEKYFDVFIKNPYKKIAAYQLSFDGIVISDLQNFVPDYSPTFKHHNSKVATISVVE